MLIHSDELTTPVKLQYDVCIMGGGVAGLVLARELKNSVNNIALIESGGESYDPEIQKLYSSNTTNKHYFDPKYSRLRFLGGSSNHWENNTSPLDETDFKIRDWVSNSGWPISFSELKDYYKKAGFYCGVKSDGYDTDAWVQKLSSENMVSGSTILKTGIAKASSPPVSFFNQFGKEIIDSHVTIYKYANVVDLKFDEVNKKVTHVYFENTKHIRHEIKAKVFIMCFGGIENARMLLSFNKKYNDVIGNQNDNVGRYFMDHPMVRAAHFYPNDKDNFKLYQPHNLNDRVVLGYLKLHEDIVENNQINNLRMPLIETSNYTLSDGISSHHIIADSLSRGEIPDHFGVHITNYLTDIDMVAEAISRKTLDIEIFDYADEFGGYELNIMMEQSPNRHNRIKLGSNSDRYNIPKIDIDWKIYDDDKDRLWKALEITAKEVGALSLGRMRLLKERQDRLWDDQLGFGHHHMGTTRMSDNPAKGVVDRNQLIFGVKNLYVAGSSVFPTGGHVPPTLTIVALTIRLSKHLKKELSNG